VDVAHKLDDAVKVYVASGVFWSVLQRLHINKHIARNAGGWATDKLLARRLTLCP
jgi:hypothetical protein